MSLDELRRHHQARPFAPFVIRVADGRSVAVRHPENLAISPTGRTVAGYASDGTTEIVDVLLITGLTLLPEHDGRRRRRRSA
jgi:hypothetical protein